MMATRSAERRREEKRIPSWVKRAFLILLGLSILAFLIGWFLFWSVVQHQGEFSGYAQVTQVQGSFAACDSVKQQLSGRVLEIRDMPKTAAPNEFNFWRRSKNVFHPVVRIQNCGTVPWDGNVQMTGLSGLLDCSNSDWFPPTKTGEVVDVHLECVINFQVARYPPVPDGKNMITILMGVNFNESRNFMSVPLEVELAQ